MHAIAGRAPRFPGITVVTDGSRGNLSGASDGVLEALVRALKFDEPERVPPATSRGHAEPVTA